MPSFNITIEDTSPIILYSSGWRAGHSSDDPHANLYELHPYLCFRAPIYTRLAPSNRYSQSSFTVTSDQNAFVSFTFNGTGVEIYGAKRQNHGLYQVKLDDTVYPSSNGSVPDPGTFQVPLFSSGSLAQGLHTVTLKNQQGHFLDIDFVCSAKLTFSLLRLTFLVILDHLGDDNRHEGRRQALR